MKSVLFILLRALSAAGAIVAGLATAAAARHDPVAEALHACLAAPDHPFEAARASSRVPPGVMDKPAQAIPVGGPRGRAFAYAGNRSNVITCGVALYGPVSASERKKLRLQIEQGALRLQAAPPDFYRVDARAGTASYWGDVRAPGLVGVLMLERSPGGGAPTVDIEYHRILVR
ncbi:MAG TPA: hypothetical protein VGC56_06950 [Allosphingosinicella sp.]|jgi:hypothetical protein